MPPSNSYLDCLLPPSFDTSCVCLIPIEIDDIQKFTIDEGTARSPRIPRTVTPREFVFTRSLTGLVYVGHLRSSSITRSFACCKVQGRDCLRCLDINGLVFRGTGPIYLIHKDECRISTFEEVSGSS